MKLRPMLYESHSKLLFHIVREETLKRKRNQNNRTKKYFTAYRHPSKQHFNKKDED